MKPLWLGISTAIVIAIGAGFVLTNIEMSSADRYSVSDTRL